MRRFTVTVLACLAVTAAALTASVAAQPEDPGARGLERACSNPTPDVKNPNCEETQTPPSGGGGGEGGPQPPARSFAEAAADDCLSDRTGDGTADGCDAGDNDRDGAPNAVDTCRDDRRRVQLDHDGDGRGSRCDDHFDDADSDFIGDGYDPDDDNNGIADAAQPVVTRVGDIVERRLGI